MISSPRVRDAYTEHKRFANVLECVEPIARYDAILNKIDEHAQTPLLIPAAALLIM